MIAPDFADPIAVKASRSSDTSALPIDAVLADIRHALTDAGTLVLQAPPGAGKTTRVPPALLAEPWLAGKGILMLEPRRLAARAAACFMSAQRGEQVGGTIGYRTRMDTRISPVTRIEVLTEAILTRRLQQDPGLDGVGLVIFDEFHERHLQTDLGLALCLDAARALRPDLRILIMSATLDAAGIAARLQASMVVSEGRSHPVALHYRPSVDRRNLASDISHCVREALAEGTGDMLVFLPGVAEIRRVADVLGGTESAGFEVLKLYGDLPQDAQDHVLRRKPGGYRRVILATAIAETSLTLDGVSIVIDSGWSRVPRFDPPSGLTRLVTVRVAEDTATQRAGRAGRQGPGVCYRLWPASLLLQPATDPEILHADLAGLALELAVWGVRDPAELIWFSPPPGGALAQARDLLQRLEAIDADNIVTSLGREMAALPTHPRLAHMLLRAREHEAVALACDIAALLGERDILKSVDNARRVDFSSRIEALTGYRQGGRAAAQAYGVDAATCARVLRIADQLRRAMRIGDKQTAGDLPDKIGLLLSFAYPDRVARQRHAGTGGYRLANGRGAVLADDSALFGRPWLVAVDVESAGEGRIFRAVEIDESVLRLHHADAMTSREIIAWDARQQAVLAQRETCFGELTVDSRPLQDADPARVASALLAGLRSLGIEALPWSDVTRLWRMRVLSLRQWRPDEDWPDVSDTALMQTLEDWLLPYLDGMSRREHLQSLDLPLILSNLLTYEQRRRLADEAPTHLTVPSGSQIRLEYPEVGAAPVLAVKLQEMFGLAETPRICAGRIPVTLHLLSPARRPIQVTQDLHGFWERTYKDVKKELQGRYPKHPWPDDPWRAVPTARAKPRSR